MTRPTWDQTSMNHAHVAAERSRCDRDKVGAAIVTTNLRVHATGYNGPPRGMPLRDVNTGELLPEETGCASWCPRAAEAAQNTSPSLDPEYRDCPSLHAEANALLYADASAIKGGTIYITSGICYNCAKLVANSGLRRVVCDVTHSAPHRDIEKTVKLLKDCGIVFDAIVH